MTEGLGCGAGAPPLAELAVGALAGSERALALQHVFGCPACRRELGELAQAADALLQLAPPVEPPAGFESAVLAGLAVEPSRSRGWGWRRRVLAGLAVEPSRSRGWGWRRRVLAGVAVVSLAAGGGAAVVWQRTAPDRQLAQQYRGTLAAANGRYLKAAGLTTGAGARAGTVFLYQGSPSWLLVTVSDAADGQYTMTAVDRGGAEHPLGACVIAGRAGTAGYGLDLPVSRVGRIELRGVDGTRLVATF